MFQTAFQTILTFASALHGFKYRMQRKQGNQLVKCNVKATVGNTEKYLYSVGKLIVSELYRHRDV